MGLYDMLPKGSQVKCWDCSMETKKVGDTVYNTYPEYVVLLVEGGYVRVKDGIITKIVENKHHKCYYPEEFPGIPCIDKWGGTVNDRKDLEYDKNVIGGSYYWWKE